MATKTFRSAEIIGGFVGGALRTTSSLAAAWIRDRKGKSPVQRRRDLGGVTGCLSDRLTFHSPQATHEWGLGVVVHARRNLNRTAWPKALPNPVGSASG